VFHERSHRPANGDDIAGARFPNDRCGWWQFRLSPRLRERPRRRPIFRLILSLPLLLVVTRFVWPLHLSLSVKFVAALLLLVASQYHFWSRLSSGSMFAPEFPRPIVLLFNWAFGAIIFLALLQLVLDGSTLIAMVVHGGKVIVPDGARYAIGAISRAEFLSVGRCRANSDPCAFTREADEQNAVHAIAVKPSPALSINSRSTSAGNGNVSSKLLQSGDSTKCFSLLLLLTPQRSTLPKTLSIL
jgi:hypothetical protein